jgi:hypothetical protein
MFQIKMVFPAQSKKGISFAKEKIKIKDNSTD